MVVTDQKAYLFVTGVIAGSGGLIYGYDVGIISGAMFQLNNRFNMDNNQQGLVVSLLSIGSLSGCLLAGYICDKIGRWKYVPDYSHDCCGISHYF